MFFFYKNSSNETLSKIIENLFELSGFIIEFRQFRAQFSSYMEQLVSKLNNLSSSTPIHLKKAIVLPRLLKMNAGDTLSSVAKREGIVDIHNIGVLNEKMTPQSAEAGSILVLPADFTWEKDKFGNETVVKITVPKPSYLWDIAIEKYNDPLMDKNIAKINNISDHGEKIEIGTTLLLSSTEVEPYDEKDILLRHKLKMQIADLFSSPNKKSDKDKATKILLKLLALPEIEGYRSYMYLDTSNKVTIGIGTNIHAFEDIANKKLELCLCGHNSNRDSNDNCLENEHPLLEDPKIIRKVHEQVKNAPHGKFADSYFEFNSFEIDSKDDKGQALKNKKNIFFSRLNAEKAAAEHIESKCFEKRIDASFKNYESYPLPALVGLADMIYNIGEEVSGFIKKFPSCVSAIKDKDWKKAAVESHRKELGNAKGIRTRNILDYELFIFPTQIKS